MQRCDQRCPWCARDFWNWLKARERQMSIPQKGMTTSFAEAARTSIKAQ